jgi:hypothetical protein
VGNKVKNMESEDDNTVTGLATCLYLLLFVMFERIIFLALMDVGGNVLQAASQTVSKDKTNDPGAIVEVSKNIVIGLSIRIIYI